MVMTRRGVVAALFGLPSARKLGAAALIGVEDALRPGDAVVVHASVDLEEHDVWCLQEEVRKSLGRQDIPVLVVNKGLRLDVHRGIARVVA